MADEPSVMEEALAEAQKLQNQKKMEENTSSENESDQVTGPSLDTDDKQQVEQPETVEYRQIVDEQGRSYSTGKRKDATARVWLKPGSGKIEINGRQLETYFARPVLRMLIHQPFEVANRKNQFDVYSTVKGGGLSGQAGAVRHGIAKALTLFEPELRDPLKKGGFLTRDSRVVERKKYGRRKARRSFQFSKR